MPYFFGGVQIIIKQKRLDQSFTFPLQFSRKMKDQQSEGPFFFFFFFELFCQFPRDQIVLGSTRIEMSCQVSHLYLIAMSATIASSDCMPLEVRPVALPWGTSSQFVHRLVQLLK